MVTAEDRAVRFRVSELPRAPETETEPGNGNSRVRQGLTWIARVCGYELIQIDCYVTHCTSAIRPRIRNAGPIDVPMSSSLSQCGYPMLPGESPLDRLNAPGASSRMHAHVDFHLTF